MDHYARLDAEGSLVIFSVSWVPADPSLVRCTNVDAVRNPGKYTIINGKIRPKPVKGVTP